MSYSETITYKDLTRILESIPLATFTYGRGEVGEIKPFAGSTVPTGWLMCNGQAVSRADYAELFDVIGTTYGTGDGSTTFNLPDLRNRFMVGAGDEYSLNDKGGAKTVTLDVTQIPAHAHIPNNWIVVTNKNYVSAGDHVTSSTSGSFSSKNNATKNDDNYISNNTGGGQAHENRPPYIGINFIIYAKNTKSVASPQIDLFYPVGSYYETSDASFDPNIMWGGTWMLETEGQVHVSAGTNYGIGNTGGEAEHTLIVNEIPAHDHTVAVAYPFTAGGSKPFVPYASNSTEYGSGYSNVVKTSGGGGHAHNNMQPYIVVNRWHRTA